ncbi:MAG: zinc-binding protein [Cyanobacteria bacterium DS3.002]|nr:zinc-binding protein [Cyanobacteria bacterium DS3.002]MBA4049736.1 zinc-binding protein [Cyanobacteria bacterium DS2.008]MBA4073411.1 zinc-binding protein [Cyanobacteria bacterium PR.023]
MTIEDKTLNCRDCSQNFVFTAGEQEFFAKKLLIHEPTRCPNCRISLRAKRTGRNPDICTEVSCHECGTLTKVPFKPTGTKPVYCLNCLHKEQKA